MNKIIEYLRDKRDAIYMAWVIKRRTVVILVATHFVAIMIGAGLAK